MQYNLWTFAELTNQFPDHIYNRILFSYIADKFMRFCPISHIQAAAIHQNHSPQHRFRRNATVARLN